ncbi:MULTISPECIES: aminotransferase class IV family protein [Sulfurimonas]|uniref:aminotransferase class IV family protein n=1 Tax=Sulfurimonas TaxID=202746 RepID=UPI0012650047|nr:aminotransferase class IV family protein [Sulfurimonas indica]
MKIEFLETIKVLDGKLCNLAYHQQRYERTLRSFGIENFIQLKDILKPPHQGLYRCRVLYSTDGELTQSYHPYKKRNMKSLKLIDSDTIAYDKKYANREALERLFAKREACDDILIVQNGLVTDTTIANIACFDGDLWLTPKKPLLAGTTRQRLLESGFLKEADIPTESLNRFEKLAVMNAMIDFDIITDKKIEEIIC